MDGFTFFENSMSLLMLFPLKSDFRTCENGGHMSTSLALKQVEIRPPIAISPIHQSTRLRGYWVWVTGSVLYVGHGCVVLEVGVPQLRLDSEDDGDLKSPCAI